ncbi:MAG: dUTP diphosphatase [Candidatus Ratteibacteria bacterium]|nr:dUTP diphosphatase [Candidatus Ratteibacteria bacterium]
MIELKIERTEEAKKLDIALPSYQHEGDAGLDLRAAKQCIIKKGTRQTVPTGIKIAVPSGYFGLIKDRSGLASKHGIHTLAGVVDCGYRGEVAVVLHNLGAEDFNIDVGMRIAQLLIVPVASVKITETPLDETSRGANGWGSTGHK